VYMFRSVIENMEYLFTDIHAFTRFSINILWLILILLMIIGTVTNAKTIGVGLTGLVNFVFSRLYGEIKKNQARNEVTALRKSKLGYFLNDLVIDLKLKNLGVDVPLAIMYFIGVNLVMSALVALVLVGSVWGVFLVFPVVSLGSFVVLYNRAAKGKLVRMMDLLEAENIICNGIEKGFIYALKESVDTIPEGLRTSYQDYIISNTVLGRHHSDALRKLKESIGYESVDTLEKIENFIDNEAVGSAGIFREVVTLNNTKIELRNHMERVFSIIKTDFNNSLLIIGIGVLGVNIIYEHVRYFYLETLLGNMVILLNIVIIMAVFGYITSLQARSF
jgi:Flp pilus assembly protein TadB